MVTTVGRWMVENQTVVLGVLVALMICAAAVFVDNEDRW